MSCSVEHSEIGLLCILLQCILAQKSVPSSATLLHGVLPGLVQTPALPQKVQLPKQCGSRQRPDLAGAHTALFPVVMGIIVQGGVATALLLLL